MDSGSFTKLDTTCCLLLRRKHDFELDNERYVSHRQRLHGTVNASKRNVTENATRKQRRTIVSNSLRGVVLTQQQAGHVTSCSTTQFDVTKFLPVKTQRVHGAILGELVGKSKFVGTMTS